MLALTGKARLWSPAACGSACSPRPPNSSPPVRRKTPRLARHWPWTEEITAALARLALLPTSG
jgi:hypothetical protein